MLGVLSTDSAQKMKFSIMDLVTFTEEILNRKLHFLSNEPVEKCRQSSKYSLFWG